MDTGTQLAWRSAVVPIAARGRVRLGAADAPPDPRERAIDAMVDWCRDGDRPLWLIEGGPGAGKSDLALEVAHRLTAERWPCGWARPGLGAYAVTAAARNGRRALILVDDAETRADLMELLRAVANNGNPLPVRVIVIAREFGPWWRILLERLSIREREVLASGRTVMGGGQVAAPTPQAVALRSQEIGATGAKGQALGLLATADPASASVLLRQAALVVALSTRVGQLGPAEVRAALRDLFEEAEGYWRRTAGEIVAPGQPYPALRAALAASAVVGTEGLSDAATVLRRVPALAVGAADRLARLAVWWHGLYARTGDSAVPTPRLPAWLAERLPDGADSSGMSWTVAALDVERRTSQTLAQLALDAHRDIWPRGTAEPEGRGAADDAATAHASLRRAVNSAAPVDEALAWLIQELDLDEEELDVLGEAITYPTRSLARTAIVLARRLVDAAETDEERAVCRLSLGARYSELGRWGEARRQTELAVEILRGLADQDRGRYLTHLATAVSNLASCLAQLGEREEALTVSYEAVAMYRELLESDREHHLPALARALTNLSACLSRSGKRPAALGAAGQAVSIYRELVEVNPSAYRAELAAADHNWRVCRDAMRPVVATGRASVPQALDPAVSRSPLPPAVAGPPASAAASSDQVAAVTG